MLVTETIYNEIKQRLVYCSEQHNEMANEDTYTECLDDLAYYEGRMVELHYILETLDSLRKKDNKQDENLSTSV